jgi:hypothetical protein
MADVAPAGRAALTVEAVEQVVAKDRADLTRCFLDHRGDLSSPRGEVVVRFTVLGSGVVSAAEAMGELANSGAGECVADRIRQLSFPKHRDQQVTLSLPVAYSLGR